MVTIPGGSFEMGCTPNDSSCSQYILHHTVDVPAFEMSLTEVTNEQYAVFLNLNGTICGETECVDANSRVFQLVLLNGLWVLKDLANSRLPINEVSWSGAKAFCEAGGARLPSEAEWEYATRAGTTTIYPCGNDKSCLDSIAWTDQKLHLVAEKIPNDFGLFDMLGNVFEWTADCYHPNYTNAPSDGSAWITDCHRTDGYKKMVRGGQSGVLGPFLSASSRHRHNPSDGNFDLGFRCVRDMP